MIRIVHLLYSGLGGHGSVVFSMVAGWRGSTTEQHSLLFYGVEAVRPEYLEKVHALGLDFGYVTKGPGLDLTGQLKLLKQLLRMRPDAILAHSQAGLPAVFLFKSLKPRTRLLYVEHQSNALKSRSQWIASTIAPGLCGHVVYLTNTYLREVRLRTGRFFQEKRSRVISNGIDLSLFMPEPSRQERHALSIGMASRLNALKDVDTLIRAMVHTSTACTLSIAGDGESRPMLESLVLQLGLGSRVQFLGVLDEPALADFLKKLDIYVHATLGETQSTAIMQAQACGLPVVATSVAGVDDQICHDADGLLVPPRRPMALAREIDRLQSTSERRRLGAAAREKALANYSHIEMAANYRILLLPGYSNGKTL